MTCQSFYVLLLLTFSAITSFKWNTSLVRKKFSILNSNNENDNSFYNDIEDIFKNMNMPIPRPIEDESQIIDDSFEGYLRTHFEKIKNKDNFINFETFYNWRKTIGALLTEQEVRYIYDLIVENDKCDLINFIKVNNEIDENDGADF